MIYEPFYNPEKSYKENFAKGPFGVFANNEIIQTKGELQYDFLGQKVNSLFGIPAGPLINGKFVQAALDKDFDIVTYKTVRSIEYPCHPWPNILFLKINDDLTLEKSKNKLIANKNYLEPLSITNSFGVPSPDPEFWQEDMRNVLKNLRKGQVMVGSFQGTKKEGQKAEEFINDFKVTAKLLKDTGVKVMEVNLSCPNEGSNNLLCYDVIRSVQVVRAIKEVINDIPLIIKIGYYKDYEILKSFVKKIGSVVQAISAINTIAAEIVDENGVQALPGEGRLISGVCGQAIKWAGLDMVRKLKRIRIETKTNFKIIGVGGVMNRENYKEYIDAGADFVMSATGSMWNPYLARDIKNEKYN